MSMKLASQLQPRKLQQQNIAIARSGAQLSLQRGKFFLDSIPTPDKLSSRKIHWGSVDRKQLLTALEEKGIVVDHDTSSLTRDNCYNLKNVNGSSEPFQLHFSASETIITGHADETLVSIICEAIDSAADGI